MPALSSVHRLMLSWFASSVSCTVMMIAVSEMFVHITAAAADSAADDQSFTAAGQPSD